MIIMISNEHENYIKSLKREKLKVTLLRIGILLFFIILWEIAADFKWIDPFLTSSPSRMISSLIGFISDGTL